MSGIRTKFINDSSVTNAKLAPELKFRKLTFSYADFSDASTTKSLSLLAIPAGSLIEYIIVHTTLEFSGGSNTTVSVSVGSDLLNPTDLISSYDVSTANPVSPVNSATYPTAGILPGLNFDAHTTSITLNTDVSNDTLTQGTLDVYIKYSVLP